MKITVSYINSKYDNKETIKKIDSLKNVAAIHADLMDGCYVSETNFNKNELGKLFSNTKKKIDVHLMTIDPEEYVDELYKLNTNIIFFHPKTTKNALDLINDINSHHCKSGIVINPDEDAYLYEGLYKEVDAILIMSVIPGKGGQHFLRDSLVNYELIKELKDKYHYEIYVDGGINDETIKFVKDSDGVIVGSYVCLNDNYQNQIDNLLSSLEEN